jgi:hypothetical protein
MIAAPIVHPADPETGMAAADVWVPEGTWIDYTTKETFTGPRWVRLVGDLHRLPMLVRAGAILPLAPPFDAVPPPCLASGTTDAIPRDRLVLSIFPGAHGTFRLYEDDGVTQAYQEGQCEWTEITTRVERGDTWVVHVAPVEGRCDALPDRRGYEVRLEGSRAPDSVIVDGADTADWTYDPETLTTAIHVSLRDKRQPLTVTAFAEGGISALGEPHNSNLIRADVARLLGDRCPPEPGDVDAVLCLDAPGRADAVARLGGPFARFVEFTAPEESSQHLGRVIVAAPALAREPCDVAVTFTLFRAGEREQHTVEVEGATESLILDAPFAFDGQVRPARWEADARITWRGQTLTYTHRSRPLFPTITAWRALVYDREQEPIALEQVMDSLGRIDDALGWKAYVQTAQGLRNVNQPHAIRFSKEYGPEMRAGKPLAGYLASTIVSPSERDVVLEFQSAGPTGLYLNGRQVGVKPAQEAENVHPFFRRPRETAVVHLRPGENTLVVDTRPSSSEHAAWFFGAAVLTPDGDVMTDLVFG